MKRLLVVALIAVGLVYGCGPTPPPPISVTLSPSAAQAIDQGQTLSISATVANDSLAKGVTWTVTGGGTLSATTGSPVTYTAPTSGSANITAAVTATSVADATKAASVNIVVSPPPAITTTTLPDGTEFAVPPYNQTVAKTGGAGTVTFSISVGALPAGLTINSSTGAITGTPTGPNVQTNFTVRVTDSSNATAMSATQALSITINLPPAPSITTASPLPADTEFVAYSQTIAATGGHGTYTFTIVTPGTGTLPAGLSMDASGHITGAPTGPDGVSTFTVQVADQSNPVQTTTKDFSLTINLPPPPTISPASLSNGNVGTPYSQTLTVSGGHAPFTFSVSSGTPPAGLSLSPLTPTNGTTATISGQPTTQQSNVAFTIQVTDSSNPVQTGSQGYTVTIAAALPLSITTTSPLPQGQFNTAYNTTISATGGVGPYTFSVDSTGDQLSSIGLSMNSQGAISGTPTAAGTWTNLKIDVTDSATPTANTASQTFTLVITASVIVISPTTGSLPPGTVNTAYNTTISATGGVSPYTFSVGSGGTPLPTWATLSSSGVISGTPTASDTGTTSGIIVDVTDSEHPPVVQQATYSLTVNANLPSCTNDGLHNGLLSGPYAFVLQGFDANGAVARAGTFVADGSGHLTDGVEDINRAGTTSGTGRSYSNPAIDTARSSYSVGSDNRGCLTIASTGGFSTLFRFALGGISGGVATNGSMIEFDDADGTGTRVGGPIRQQNSSTFNLGSLTGHYTMRLTGVNTNGQFRQAVAGYMQLDGTGGMTGADDAWDASGNPGDSNASFTGTYSVASNGRGTAVVTGPHSPPPSDFAIYVINANDMFMIGTDPASAGPVMSGEAVKASGSLTVSSGHAVYYSTSLNDTGQPKTQILRITTTATDSTHGSLSFTGYKSSGGALSVQNQSGITYTIDANGRMTMTCSGCGGGTPVFYLSGPNRGFSVGTDNQVESGVLQPQSATALTFTTGSTFFYGEDIAEGPNVSESVGAGTVTSPGNASSAEDDSSNGSPYLEPNQTNTFAYSFDSNGVWNGATDTFAMIVSGTEFVLMNNHSEPKVMIIQP